MQMIYKDSKGGKTANCKLSNNIIAVFEGNILPKELKLWDGSTGIKVFPFIERVKQCYNCFKYGRFQAQCRSTKKCIRCGNEHHEMCTNELKCLNCQEEHHATSKNCKMLIFNKKIKETMATYNISFQSAKSRIRQEEETIGSGAPIINAWFPLRNNVQNTRLNTVENIVEQRGRASYYREPKTVIGTNSTTTQKVGMEKRNGQGRDVGRRGSANGKTETKSLEQELELLLILVAEVVKAMKHEKTIIKSKKIRNIIKEI